jgi:predicted ArsR family transcriptional regulator
MKKKLSDTSMAAFKAVHPQMKIDHWSRILFAMRILNVPATMEQIAAKAGMELNQVTRRMNEIEKEGLVHKDGIGKTKSGRACSKYSILNQAEAQNKIIEGQTDEQFFDNYLKGHFPNLPEHKGAIQISLL